MSNKKQPSPAKQAYEEKKAAKQEAKKKEQEIKSHEQQGTNLDKALGTKVEIDLKAFQDQHLFIATPAYGGMVGEPYLKAMTKIGILFSKHGLNFTLATIANESLITRGRNTLVAMFMSNPKFTDMLFIDADIHFEAEDVLKLWWRAVKDREKVKVITGAYPKKTINWKNIRDQVVTNNASEDEMQKYQASYVLNLRTDNSGRIPLQQGLLPVYDAGTGFMLFDRSVIQSMMDKWPELHYKNDLNTDAKFDPYMYALFDTIICPDTKRYLSEDYTFCRRWQEIGGTIWMDPSINLDHQGTYVFKGNIGNQFVVQEQISDNIAKQMEQEAEDKMKKQGD